MKLETLYYFKVSKIKSSRKITLPNKLSRSRKDNALATHAMRQQLYLLYKVLNYRRVSNSRKYSSIATHVLNKRREKYL